MTKRRLILLLVIALLAVGIVYERGVANELDVDCPNACLTGCANEEGCLLYRQIGCNCSYVCRSGTRGSVSGFCGGE